MCCGPLGQRVRPGEGSSGWGAEPRVPGAEKLTATLGKRAGRTFQTEGGRGTVCPRARSRTSSPSRSGQVRSLPRSGCSLTRPRRMVETLTVGFSPELVCRRLNFSGIPLIFKHTSVVFSVTSLSLHARSRLCMCPRPLVIDRRRQPCCGEAPGNAGHCPRSGWPRGPLIVTSVSTPWLSGDTMWHEAWFLRLRRL